MKYLLFISFFSFFSPPIYKIERKGDCIQVKNNHSRVIYNNCNILVRAGSLLTTIKQTGKKNCFIEYEYFASKTKQRFVSYLYFDGRKMRLKSDFHFFREVTTNPLITWGFANIQTNPKTIHSRNDLECLDSPITGNVKEKKGGYELIIHYKEKKIFQHLYKKNDYLVPFIVLKRNKYLKTIFFDKRNDVFSEFTIEDLKILKY